MKASELMRDWPSRGPEREARVVQAIKDGHFLPIEWQAVEVSRMGHRGKFWIARDALMVGEPGDAVRVNVSPRTAQEVCDMLGASLPTTFILDEVVRQCGVTVEPRIQPPDTATRTMKGLSPYMDDTWAMVKHSDDVEKALAAATQPPRIISNVGKHWVLSNRISSSVGKAANYGWYTRSAPYRSASGFKMWQTLGTQHNDQHVDYSQCLQPVSLTMEADGTEMRLPEVAAHQDLWCLVSDEGPLKVLRIAGVKQASTEESAPVSSVNFPPDELGTVHEGLEDIVSLYLEAKNYTKVDRSKEIRYVVLHTAEIKETLTAAEALAKWCAGPNAPRASWHFATDADTVTQSVKEEYVAWHAPGANRTGIGIEMAGAARQSADEWHDEFSWRVLQRTARLVAYLCRRWNIPVQFIDASGLNYGVRGITTHAEVTKAFKKSTHTDPGKSFPMDEFLRLVREQS
jgi:N-acetyl-anhydromuramyl-L-alanine amidase AmpD